MATVLFGEALMAIENEVKGVLERFIGDVKLKVAGLEVRVDYGLTPYHVHHVDFFKDSIWVLAEYSIPRDSWGVTLLARPERETYIGFGGWQGEVYRLS